METRLAEYTNTFNYSNDIYVCMILYYTCMTVYNLLVVTYAFIAGPLQIISLISMCYICNDHSNLRLMSMYMCSFIQWTLLIASAYTNYNQYGGDNAAWKEDDYDCNCDNYANNSITKV